MEKFSPTILITILISLTFSKAEEILMKPKILANEIEYRADIDGLRAIAVLSVIFFHLNIIGFSGGFVGVDVFFVISGYLISSIILNDIHYGNFSITRFYERRIRRIFPALYTVIAFTIIVGFFLLDANTFELFGKSVTATSFFSSNILYWRESGYFSPKLTNPLLHTWSIAVEEQFYIFFPLLLISINSFFKARYLTLLLGICIISFLISVNYVYFHKVATFYLLPTRAWELLFGAILSLQVLPKLKSNGYRNFVSLAGLSLILFSIGFYSESTLFPGPSALAPVLGAGFIIYSGFGSGTSIVKKYLSLSPIVFIGLISYSLYLWHWPLTVFVKYMIFRNLTIVDKIGIILASFIISVLSHKFIEQPFRMQEPLIPNRKKIIGLSAGMTIIFSIIGTVIYLQKGIPSRYPEAEAFVKESRTDYQENATIENKNQIDGLQVEFIKKTIGMKKGNPSFLIWGDSHAEYLSTGLSELGKKYQLMGYVISRGGVKPLLGMDYYGILLNDVQNKYNQSVIDFIKVRPEIKTVILAGMWSHEESLIDVSGEYLDRKKFSFFLRVGLLRTVKTILKMGRNIIVVCDVPWLKEDPNRILYISRRFNTEPDFKQITPTFDDYQDTNKDMMLILKDLEKFTNVSIVHPESLFFKTKAYNMVMSHNKTLYSDYNHLTKIGSRFISPAFEFEFKKMAKENTFLIAH